MGSAADFESEGCRFESCRPNESRAVILEVVSVHMPSNDIKQIQAEERCGGSDLCDTHNRHNSLPPGRRLFARSHKCKDEEQRNERDEQTCGDSRRTEVALGLPANLKFAEIDLLGRRERARFPEWISSQPNCVDSIPPLSAASHAPVMAGFRRLWWKREFPASAPIQVLDITAIKKGKNSKGEDQDGDDAGSSVATADLIRQRGVFEGFAGHELIVVVRCW